jgi:hypothetical protein
MEDKKTRDVHGYRRNPWYQPGDRYPLEIEYALIRKLYPSLKKGYFPRWFRSFPEVILLVRCNGEWRAVRENGQHRLSILSHLGYDRVTVLIPSGSITVAHEAEVKEWYYVKRGLCSPEQALEIFHAYFDLNGRERIEYLGLPSGY